MAPEKMISKEAITLNNIIIKKICYHNIDITTSIIEKTKVKTENNNDEILINRRINLNKTYGDPLPDVIKQIHFNYIENGESKTLSVNEFEGIIQKDVHIVSYKVDCDLKRKIFLYCNPTHMGCFAEYIRSFQHLIDFELIHDNSAKIRLDDIVISIYEKHPNIKCENNCFINTEQISRLDVRANLKNVVKDNLILDYSKEHLKLMDDLLYLPYAYNKDEVDKLKEYLVSQPKLYDVSFVGAMSPKRQIILDKLREKGIKVIVANTWGDERDKMIAQSKLLINIHYNDSYNIYESIRCDRWLFANHVVVSENSSLLDELDIKNTIIFEKYDSLVDRTMEVLSNYEKYNKGYNLEEVIDKRKQSIEGTLNKIITNFSREKDPFFHFFGDNKEYSIFKETLNNWEKIIKEKLIPEIEKVHEPLEGNIYCNHSTTNFSEIDGYKSSTYYYDRFVAKQYNIYTVSKEKKNNKALEIGFNSGFSALLILLSNPKVKLTCVDINYHKYTVPCYNTLKAIFGDRINLLIGDSNSVVPTLKEKYDLIHIDGSHEISIAEKDIINCEPLTENNCTMIMDDTDYQPLDDMWKRYSLKYRLQNCNLNLKNSPYHSIKRYNKNREIVFYSCFFGNDTNVANKVPFLPSNKYDCYFFTNNPSSYEKLKNTGWNRVFLSNIPIKDDDVGDSFDSKELKSCPHHYEVLNNYDHSCYFDSKVYVDENRIIEHIKNMTKNNKIFSIPQHPFLANNVWNEYRECLHQPRYYKEKDKYYSYINKQLSLGLKDNMQYHYTTNFIIRKTGKEVMELNEKWYEHIKICGIECQISFFFIQQLYKDYINTIDYGDGFSYDLVKLVEKRNTCDIVFNNTYETELWGEEGDGSGAGSGVDFTKNLRKILVKFMIDNKMTDFIDCPCGAGKWAKFFVEDAKNNVRGFNYTGVDVSSVALLRARKNLGDKVPLYNLDISCDILPKTTGVLMCRDTLQHLSPKYIIKGIQNIARTGATWILIGGYAGINKTLIMGNISEQYFDFNPMATPYCLEPEQVIKENHPNTEPPKYLFVYLGSYLRSFDYNKILSRI